MKKRHIPNIRPTKSIEKMTDQELHDEIQRLDYRYDQQKEFTDMFKIERNSELLPTIKKYRRLVANSDGKRWDYIHGRKNGFELVQQSFERYREIEESKLFDLGRSLTYLDEEVARREAEFIAPHRDDPDYAIEEHELSLHDKPIEIPISEPPKPVPYFAKEFDNGVVFTLAKDARGANTSLTVHAPLPDATDRVDEAKLSSFEARVVQRMLASAKDSISVNVQGVCVDKFIPEWSKTYTAQVEEIRETLNSLSNPPEQTDTFEL